MGKLAALFAALRHGSTLADPAGWKSRQNTLNALVGLIGAVLVVLPMFGVRLEISNEDLLALAGGIAALLGLLNPYLTTATTDKLGVGKPRPEPEQPHNPTTPPDVPTRPAPAAPSERAAGPRDGESAVADVFRGD